ncbi:hypothetical protein HXX02_03600 [Microbulbifer elongatus]|uniref:Uncharacterized protein n=1 Tax=Microbulbifer elongatus TaxID=86173 RepID=A0ABT1NX99_9GAMM|nr:DUF6387 family protein [Microbulbifer elongatus]MCQ3828519.1 hypothetical protein [Microbulbifer elongatus]
MKTVKKIETFKELAPWFTIQNYEVSRKFHTEDWRDAIVERALTRFRIRLMLDLPNDSELTSSSPDKAVEESNLSRNSILKKIISDSCEFTRFYNRESDDRATNYKGTVRPITRGDLSFFFENLPIGDEYEYIDVVRHKALKSLHSAHLFLDLSASDKELISDFKILLKTYRKDLTGIKSLNLTEENFLNKLRQYQVLAYLDLEHWSVVTNCPTTDTLLARLLFPSGDKGERFVSDTLKPLAKAVIMPTFCSLVDGHLEKDPIWFKHKLDTP